METKSVEIKEKGKFIEGIKFTHTRAVLNKIADDIKSVCTVLSILAPVAFLIYYVVAIAISKEFNYTFFTKIVLAALVAVELLFNTAKLANKTDKKPINKFNKVKRYIKIVISAVTCGFAIYDVLMVDNSTVKIIVAGAMLALVLARIIVEIARFIVEKYLETLFEAISMDIEIIANSRIGKAAQFIMDPKQKMVEAADSFISRISGKDSITSTVDIPEFIADGRNDNEREKIRELGEAFSQQEEDKKAIKESHKKQKLKAAKQKLAEDAEEVAKKLAVGAVKSKISGFLKGKK